MMQQALFVTVGALAGYALYGASAVFGVAAVAVNFLTPFPATYVGMRFGVSSSWMVILLTAILVFLTSSELAMSMYFIQFGLPAAILCWLLRRGIAWDRAVFVSVGAIAIAALAGLFLMSFFVGGNPATLAGVLIEKEVSETAALMQNIFAEADWPAEQMGELNQALTRMSDFMLDVYAGMTLTVCFFMLLAQIFLLNLLAREQYHVPGVSFPFWKAPEPMIWLLITAGFMVFFLDGFIRIFALNILVVLLPVYFLQGLAILDNFFRRKAFSPIFRVLGYLLVVIINPLPLIVTGLGVFDLWVDFRKPRTSNS